MLREFRGLTLHKHLMTVNRATALLYACGMPYVLNCWLTEPISAKPIVLRPRKPREVRVTNLWLACGVLSFWYRLRPFVSVVRLLLCYSVGGCPSLLPCCVGKRTVANICIVDNNHWIDRIGKEPAKSFRKKILWVLWSGHNSALLRVQNGTC